MEEPDTHETWRIENFQNEPGVYFEKLGKINQVESTWKLVIKTDITAMDHRQKQVMNYMAQTRALCYDKPLEQKMKETCSTLLQLTEKEYKKAATLLTRLKKTYQFSKKTRRGLVNGLGALAKSLFGTMDADDEKIINEQLNLIKGRQQTLQHALKNQVKILNATIAHVDESEKIIQENEEKFLNITEKMRQSWLQSTKNFGYREEMDEHFIILNAIIKDLIIDITDIIAHLTSVKSGIINIRLIPIEIIIDNLKEIATQVPQGTHFPFQIAQENWGIIEKFLTISAYYDNENIITIIKLPQIMYPTYEIIKVTPLPTHKQNNTFICIEINQPIIAIDTDSRTYFTITENELQKCMRYNNEHVCEQNYPIHHIDDQALCEVQTYVQLGKHTDNCNIRYVHTNTTIWITSSNTNTWIYSTRAKQQIEITCEDETTRKVEIDRTGQLTIKGKCKIVTPDVIIRTKKSIPVTYIKTRIPDYNLTLTPQKQTDRLLNKIEAIKLRKIIKNPSEMMELSKTLTDIDKQINEDNLQVQKHIIYPAISSITGTIIIISVIAIIYTIKKSQAKRKASTNVNLNPISIPRARIDDKPYQPDSHPNDTAILY